VTQQTETPFSTQNTCAFPWEKQLVTDSKEVSSHKSHTTANLYQKTNRIITTIRLQQRLHPGSAEQLKSPPALIGAQSLPRTAGELAAGT